MKKIQGIVLFLVITITFFGCQVADTSISVLYRADQSTGGVIPHDTNTYNQGDEIIVLGNTGSLIRSGYSFDGWNTRDDGTGTHYVEGETLTIGSETLTLYAQWAPIIGIKALAGGSGFSYILQTDGALWSMGTNGAGQLGTGNTSAISKATKIMTGVKAISAGQSFAMILKDNGDLYATGDNSDGQLGTGDKLNVSTPVLVKQNVASVDCGTFYTMIIDTDGALWGAGSNGISGVLGNNSQDDYTTFDKIDVPGDAIVTSVSAGESHTLFVTENGDLYGMGNKNYGKLIRPYDYPDYDNRSWYMREPVLLSSTLNNIRSVSAGIDHSMVVTEDNELYAFGSQKYGELGNGVALAIDEDYGNDDDGIFEPFKVDNALLKISGEDAIQEVYAGSSNTLILRTDGTLYAVGSDYSHMLGDGNTSTACHPDIFEIAQEVSTVALSGSHTLYGSIDGTAWGAGYNYTSTHAGIIPSTLGQGDPSLYEYINFVAIPLDEDNE